MLWLQHHCVCCVYVCARADVFPRPMVVNTQCPRTVPQQQYAPPPNNRHCGECQTCRQSVCAIDINNDIVCPYGTYCQHNVRNCGMSCIMAYAFRPGERRAHVSICGTAAIWYRSCMVRAYNVFLVSFNICSTIPDNHMV